MKNTPLPHDHGDQLANLLPRMPQSDDFQTAAALFSQLSDLSRLRILWILCHCEECGINLAAAVGMSSAAVSHHLKILRMGGLIKSRRAGKEVYYTLENTPKAQRVHRFIDELFDHSCDKDC